MKSENIGPNHPRFHLNYPGWTQVLIRDDNDNIIAHFYGVNSKTNARNFINASHPNNMVIKKSPYICGECDCEINTITIHETGSTSFTCPNCNEEWVS